ncbi:MAG: tetratricopeptide repeat protein [Gammaproteobacteria bacterium]
MLQDSEIPAKSQRIESWKEIAAYFGKDERTVKRWETDRSMPVHRVPGDKGRVFAYSEELNLWINRAKVDGATAKPRPAEPAPAILTIKRPRRIRVWSFGALAVTAIVAFSLWGALHLRQLPHSLVPQTPINPAPVRTAPDPVAEQFYLKGLYYWNRRTQGSLTQAVDAFTQAIVHDSHYAQAYAGLADSYNLMPEYTSMPKSAAFPRAIAAANKAIALDDSLSQAHAALAFGLLYWDWNVSRSLAEYQRAIQLDPQDGDAHHWYATALLALGRFPEARSEIERARELDPASRSILADQALIGFWSGDRAQSIATLVEIQRAEPGFISAPRYLAVIFWEERDFKAFVTESEVAASISKDPRETAIAEAAKRGLSNSGERGMLEEMRRAQQSIFDKGESSGFALASTCALLGKKKEVISYLKAAFAARDFSMLIVIGSGVTDDFETLKGDPEFEQLRAQVKYRMSHPFGVS